MNDTISGLTSAALRGATQPADAHFITIKRGPGGPPAALKHPQAPLSKITKTHCLLTLALLMAITAPRRADAQFIWIDVSYKAIVDPATGQPAAYVTPHLPQEAVRFGNAMLARYRRGYRLRLVEYFWIGGSDHPRDPSRWYPFLVGPNHELLEEEFRSDAFTNYPALYGWNPSALNVFLTVFPEGTGKSAFCAECDSGRLSDYIADGRECNASTQFTAEENFGARNLHETGHYFYLKHTHGNTACITNTSGLCLAPVPGDDDLTDTLGDVQNVGDCTCWTVENLSWTNFNKGYGALNATERELVDNVWFNLMSYHETFGYSRLTEQQLDLWTDIANSFRRHVLSGVTLYVSLEGNDGYSGLTSTTPKRHVAAALDAAAPGGGDIVLLRPGNYDERVTLTRPATLRATRAGPASLGRP